MEKSRDAPVNSATIESPQLCQENHLTPGDTSNPPTDKMSTDLVPPRLLDTQEGQECEAGVDWQRDEEDVLLCEDGEQQDRDLSAEERIFLEEFPFLKRELEAAIRKCHAFADDIDRTHKTFTKTNVVTNSISVVSGVMSILGLALAPATAGGSLVLSAAGKGLGTAVGAATLFTNMLEHYHNKKVQAQASSQEPTCEEEVKGTVEKVSYILAARKAVHDYGSNIKDIKKNIRAFQIARTHPRLAAAAKRLLTTGQVSARRSRQVHKAFEGTTLVMKKNARLLGSAMTGLSLVIDLGTLLKDWKQLKEGAKTELAEKWRAKASELERKLAELTQLYESLQQQKLLQEKKPRSSFPEEAMGTLPQPPAKHEETGPQVSAIPA